MLFRSSRNKNEGTTRGRLDFAVHCHYCNLIGLPHSVGQPRLILLRVASQPHPSGRLLCNPVSHFNRFKRSLLTPLNGVENITSAKVSIPAFVFQPPARVDAIDILRQTPTMRPPSKSYSIHLAPRFMSLSHDIDSS